MRERLRLLVAAFGDPGHCFPAFALARALKARGHEVLVESWEQWRAPVGELGIEFTAAQEYTVYPPPGPDTPAGRTAAGAAAALARMLDEFRPDAVVSDILTQAPMLAAEVAGVRRVTLVPHVYPVQEPGLPLFSIGALPPRTPVGRLAWRLTLPLVGIGLRQGLRDLNETRERLGLEPVTEFQAGANSGLTLVATFPQLEYPRRWPPDCVITGPMFFELPWEEIDVPEGPEPLVLVAPSTAQDPMCHMLRAALDGLAEEPLRVVATTNKHRPVEPLDVPGNAVLEPWLSYSQLMPLADLVVCHGGHGTVARALDAGAPVLCCPAVGDMAENGARVAWSGSGLSLPRRLLGAGALRSAARRILADPSFGRRAAELAAWSRANDGAERGAVAVEEFARG
ncbi:MAG: glycosyltransferase [Solirubrobacterales bacterium]